MLQAIRELDESIRTAKTELNSCLTLIPPDKEAAKRARDELEDAFSDRIDFWRDTFRSQPEGLYLSDAYTLFETYGCKFISPTKTEIRHILDVLDSKYPGWDLKDPKQFYATLEANFPQRVKGEKKRKSSNKRSGCSAVFLFIVILFLVMVALGKH